MDEKKHKQKQTQISPPHGKSTLKLAPKSSASTVSTVATVRGVGELGVTESDGDSCHQRHRSP